MRNMLRIAAFFSIAAFVTCVQAASTPTKPAVSDIGMQPKTFMFVGNSFMYYNNSMHNHFLEVIRSADKTPGYRATSITMSGSGINWHDVDSYFKPGGVA